MSRVAEGADVVVALVTCPDAESAGTIARALVAERLAACVNVAGEVRSIYRWEGAVEEADERLLVVKTGSDRLPALAARIVELHPYDVPEILALPVARGLESYLEWIRAQVVEDGADGA